MGKQMSKEARRNKVSNMYNKVLLADAEVAANARELFMMKQENGQMSMADFKEYVPHPDSCRHLFEMIDYDRSGTINIEEFTLYHYTTHVLCENNIAKRASCDWLFRLIDVDGNERISKTECKSVMSRLICLLPTPKISKDEAKKMFDIMDNNRDGYISRSEWDRGYEEWCERLKSFCSLSEWAKAFTNQERDLWNLLDIVNALVSPLYPCLHWTHITSLLHACTAYFEHQPMLTNIRVPEGAKLNFIGDTHGEWETFHLLLREIGPPNTKNLYIFNGDMLDRGNCSWEVLAMVLAMVVYSLRNFADPCVHVLRGDHEILSQNREFWTETALKYPNLNMHPEVATINVLGASVDMRQRATYDRLLAGSSHTFMHALFAFCTSLPVAAVVNGSYFITHGGIRPGMTLAGIAALPRTHYVDDNDQLVALLYHDPGKADTCDPEVKRNTFGIDTALDFLKRNKLKQIIRSHEIWPAGCGNCFANHQEKLTDDKKRTWCVTVHSAIFPGKKDPRNVHKLRPCYLEIKQNTELITLADVLANVKTFPFDSAISCARVNRARVRNQSNAYPLRLEFLKTRLSAVKQMFKNIEHMFALVSAKLAEVLAEIRHHKKGDKGDSQPDVQARHLAKMAKESAVLATTEIMCPPPDSAEEAVGLQGLLMLDSADKGVQAEGDLSTVRQREPKAQEAADPLYSSNPEVTALLIFQLWSSSLNSLGAQATNDNSGIIDSLIFLGQTVDRIVSQLKDAHELLGASSAALNDTADHLADFSVRLSSLSVEMTNSMQRQLLNEF